jgi:transcriptional regulator with XRE-family HTH domain
MANATSPLLPPTDDLLKAFGERLRLARRRRRLQAKEVAERAGMTEVTLRRVERGLPGVTMGAYLAVMQVLQLQDDVAKWATEDALGRHLQDAELQGGTRQRRSINARTGQFAMSPESVKPRVLKAKPAQVIRTEKTVGAQPEGATRSVSATDLLKALSLPAVKLPPGKKKP